MKTSYLKIQILIIPNFPQCHSSICKKIVESLPSAEERMHRVDSMGVAVILVAASTVVVGTLVFSTVTAVVDDGSFRNYNAACIHHLIVLYTPSLNLIERYAIS